MSISNGPWPTLPKKNEYFRGTHLESMEPTSSADIKKGEFAKTSLTTEDMSIN